MTGLDLTQLSCPEFTVPALRVLKAYEEKGKEVVIKTKEQRAPVRIQHLCVAHDWSILALAESQGVILIKIKF